MKRMNWWWVVLAGAVAMSVPMAKTLAQTPAADEEVFEAPVDGPLTLAEEDFMGPPGGPAGGDEMDRHFVMRYGPGGGRGMGMGAPGGHGMGMGAGFGMRLQALDLTDEQKTKIEAIHERAQRKNIQSRADLQVAQLDLRKLLRAENPDRRAIESQIDRVSALQVGMHKANLGVMFETRALLTEAQKKQLQEMRGQRMRHGDAGEKPKSGKPDTQ
jgi:Spy/CpxP family protein refolding chaperone